MCECVSEWCDGARARDSVFKRSLEHAKMFLGVGLRMDRNPEKLDALRRFVLSGCAHACCLFVCLCKRRPHASPTAVNACCVERCAPVPECDAHHHLTHDRGARARRRNLEEQELHSKDGDARVEPCKLEKYEIVQLCNLYPKSSEEATSLIPSLLKYEEEDVKKMLEVLRAAEARLGDT